MITDRELLELAAKAAGVRHVVYSNGYSGALGLMQLDLADRQTIAWSPLADDGDALRLAVRLEVELTFSTARKTVYAQTKHLLGISKDGEASYQAHEYFKEPYGQDKDAATRRSIVRAAAEIGKGMQPFPSADEIRENWT